MIGEISPSAVSDLFVERVFDRTKGKKARPVTVRIYKPYQRARLDEWGCLLEIYGLKPKGRAFRYESTGADSVQALYLALMTAEVEIEIHRGELSWWGGELWGSFGGREIVERQL